MRFVLFGFSIRIRRKCHKRAEYRTRNLDDVLTQVRHTSHLRVLDKSTFGCRFQAQLSSVFSQ